MKAPPASTKANLTTRLNHHARAHWPALDRVEVRFRANFAYVDGRIDDDTTLKLCRLRYGGSAHTWGFAFYRASHDDYEDSYLPNGRTAGTAEEALDCLHRVPRRVHHTPGYTDKLTRGTTRRWLALLESERIRTTTGEPEKAPDRLAEYGDRWVRSRPLRPHGNASRPSVAFVSRPKRRRSECWL